MSSDKITIDQLRIDRSGSAKRGTPSWLAPALLTIVAVTAGALWWLNRPKAVVVETAVAREQAAGGQKTLLNASGYVTARRAATVSSKVTGKVIEVLVEEGMKVEADQVLARLDPSNVEAGLRLAEAQWESARKSLEETKPNLLFAQRELKRFTDLAKTRVVSESDLHRSEAEAKALEARLGRQGAEIAVAEREVAQWKQQLDDTIIRSPFGGIVTSKNAQPGEMISPMSVGGFTRTGICTIVDMSSLEVDVDVNESYINRVQPGQPVEATLDAYAGWRIPAKVIAIIPTADRQKATVKVRVGFDKLDPRILPDMGVKVAFQSADTGQAGAARGGISIPAAAVQKVNDRDVVWVVRDGRVERRAITVAQSLGDELAIAAGLSNGERVVINAPQGLAEGSGVREALKR
ncbi:MAG: efflux RND transporter periplasmic adaptor subunit [Verrucomicrobiota bacterium]|nr:efflux RND transporter periplasmic adaptor subunit [Verrucomicrobiota bacterium]